MSRVHRLVRPLYLSAIATASCCAAPVDLALHTLGSILRNSVLYVGVGWFFGFCFATGDLFTGLPPSQQSYAAFSAAVVSWFWGVFSVFMIVIMSAKLLREQFIGCSSNQIAARGPTVSLARNMTLLQCIRKLAVPMIPHLVLAGFCAVGGDFLVYSTMPPNWSKFKPILYIGFFWGFYSMVIADIYARRIFQTETVDEHPHSKPFWTPTPRRILQVYRKNLPVIVFVLIAIVYVHALSQFIHLTGKWGMFACACASIALKLSLQELAKHIMMSVRRPVSRRVMVALISTPTILVDTQVRMLLLRQDNLNVSVAGTILLAIFEIVVRALKSVVVQRKTRRPMTARQRSRRRSCESPAEYKARRDVEERRRKLRVLHAGEIYAEMYAEYIAIGCSYAILFFYRDHAQFEFRVLSDHNKQLTSLGILQLSVEVVVDFLSCVLEASEGVEFKSFNQNDPFLIFFLAMLTFSNIAISAGMYLR
ncbi:hypothetical protein PHYSODRAFT_308386 [Phytophthora sojae]|uniref:Uncharacterized protein n=1 Tax=Phytophthora sojae (strain P6497) TaxID=1094619 RepID=G4YLQ5_PHYSP|nr:hypothetical protein PHYSODRAFT_308386 [Phytophthora sojae]EGZ26675.1 hypothetical protein PHYSODRAFT_308386 [Phytophthora sojae]|eukprot:XP_009513950.1 hypothetical protein PHYSODRAFT_308386 [Phytophthora sojae]